MPGSSTSATARAYAPPIDEDLKTYPVRVDGAEIMAALPEGRAG